MKAQIIKIAGTFNGNSLFAIMDVNGYTECQIWSTPEEIRKLYTLI